MEAYRKRVRMVQRRQLIVSGEIFRVCHCPNKMILLCCFVFCFLFFVFFLTLIYPQPPLVGGASAMQPPHNLSPISPTHPGTTLFSAVWKDRESTIFVHRRRAMHRTTKKQCTRAVDSLYTNCCSYNVACVLLFAFILIALKGETLEQRECFLKFVGS
jgi:hypothetical protein